MRARAIHGVGHTPTRTVPTLATIKARFQGGDRTIWPADIYIHLGVVFQRLQHRKRADVHEGIGKQVVERGADGLIVVSGQTHQDVAGVRNAGIDQHALEAALPQRRQVAHGYDRKDRDLPDLDDHPNADRHADTDRNTGGNPHARAADRHPRAHRYAHAAANRHTDA